MSIRLEAANSERLTKAALFSGDPAFAIGGWFYLHSLPALGEYAPLWTLYNSGFVGSALYVRHDGKLTIREFTSDHVDDAVGATVLTTGNWYYVWCRKPTSGVDQLKVYLNGSTSVEVERFINNSALALDFQLATNQVSYDPDYYADVSLVNWKLWTADVAAAQAAVEMDDFAVTNTTGILAAWPLDVFTDLTDDAGTDDAFTASGTLSAGPTNPFGGVPPVGGFTVTTDEKTVTVVSTAVAGDNPITSTLYNYGDGTAATASTTHTYDVAGAHTITQTVSDGTLTDTYEQDVVTRTELAYRVKTVKGRAATVTIQRPDAALPDPATGLVLTPEVDRSVTLDWTDAAEADEYIIRRNGVEISRVAPAVETFVDPAPALFIDFDEYANYAAMIADSAKFYTVEDHLTDVGCDITLDTTGRFIGHQNSMRFKYNHGPDDGCTSRHIGRSTAVMSPAVQEAWAEFNVRFSSNFTTANLVCPPNDYKMIFGDTEADQSGRWALYLSGDQGMRVERPTPTGGTGPYALNVVPAFNSLSLADDAEHIIRLYFRHSTTTASADGKLKVWIDGVLVHNETGFNTVKPVAEGSTVDRLTSFSFAHNKDDGPPNVDMYVWWGPISVYKIDPGWT